MHRRKRIYYFGEFGGQKTKMAKVQQVKCGGGSRGRYKFLANWRSSEEGKRIGFTKALSNERGKGENWDTWTNERSSFS